RQAHALQHLRSEHARVANLNPLSKASVKTENLHRRLSVRVVRGLEAQVVYAHLGEEGAHEANQIAKREIPVGNNALNLVELSEMGGVNGFVAEDTVDG